MVMSIKNNYTVIARSEGTKQSFKSLRLLHPIKIGYAVTIKKVFGEINGNIRSE
jgi:hypothetical protein